MTLTTFIVTFFLGKAYDFWRISYKLGRSIQGRLQDINLMLATHCFRDAQGEYTPDSRSILEDTARHVRLLHGLFWAGIDDSLSSIRTQVTPSGHRTAAEGVVIAIGLPSDYHRITFGSPSDHHRITIGLPSDCLRIAIGLPSDCLRITIGSPSDCLRIAFGLPSDCLRIAFGLRSDCVWIAFDGHDDGTADGHRLPRDSDR